MNIMARIEVPIWEKINLTLPEAAALFSIGENQIRDLSNEPGCEFVIFKGSHRLIKRKNLKNILMG